MPRLTIMIVFGLIMIFAIAKIAGAEGPTPTPTPEPEHCGMSDRVPDAPDCLAPCADDEERLEDGTCMITYPPEEWTWTSKATPALTPIITSMIGTAWSVAPFSESPSSLPGTGGAPPTNE